MKKNQKRILWSAVAVIAVIALAVAIVVSLRQSEAAPVSREKAQSLLDEQLFAVLTNTKTLNRLAEKTEVTVDEMEYGLEKNIVLTCSYRTVAIGEELIAHANELLNLNTLTPNGMQKSGTAIRLELDEDVAALVDGARELNGTVTVTMYDVDGEYQVWLNDETVDCCFGGIITARRYISALESITVDGQTVSIKTKTNLRTGLIQCIDLSVVSRAKPDGSAPLIRWWNSFKEEFIRNFGNGYWRYLTNGLWNTLKITFCALLIGIFLGFLVALIRCTHDKTGKPVLLNAICKLYLTVVRGTPVMVQLLIIYFVLLLPLNVDKIIAAIVCFGINSGAYVAEIVRGGIMGIDEGQTEAGRSLGLGYARTMWYIVIPQAFRSVLPALANEFIALLKETSVASYIGVADLTRGGEIIRGVTFSNFMPLFAVALIYLVLVIVLTKLVGVLERRLRKGDRG